MRRADLEEYEWLFRATYPSVRRSAYLVLRDEGRAEEVCQEAFIRLYEKWSTVRHYERPEAWVRTVAVRMAIRAAGRERRRPLLESTARVDVQGADPALDPASDPDLARAVGQLTPMQRAAVVLYYYEDLPVLEVARVLQVSSSTVKQHLHRARAKLGEELGDVGEEVDGDVR